VGGLSVLFGGIWTILVVEGLWIHCILIMLSQEILCDGSTELLVSSRLRVGYGRFLFLVPLLQQFELERLAVLVFILCLDVVRWLREIGCPLYMHVGLSPIIGHQRQLRILQIPRQHIVYHADVSCFRRGTLRRSQVLPQIRSSLRAKELTLRLHVLVL